LSRTRRSKWFENISLGDFNIVKFHSPSTRWSDEVLWRIRKDVLVSGVYLHVMAGSRPC
jgi:hypothetical protein